MLANGPQRPTLERKSSRHSGWVSFVNIQARQLVILYRTIGNTWWCEILRTCLKKRHFHNFITGSVRGLFTSFVYMFCLCTIGIPRNTMHSPVGQWRSTTCSGYDNFVGQYYLIYYCKADLFSIINVGIERNIY